MTQTLSEDMQKQVDEALRIVKLSVAFRDIVSARIEHDEALKEKFEAAVGIDEIGNFAAEELALQLHALGSMLHISRGTIPYLSKDDLKEMNDVLGESLQLSEHYADMASKVLPDDDLSALMPIDMHNRSVQEWLKTKEAPKLASLCRVYPKAV